MQVQISRFTVKSDHTELSWEFSEVDEVNIHHARCRFEDSTSSHTTKTIFCEFQHSHSYHSSCHRDAGADLKIQMSIRPCTIHHGIKMQVQTSRFKCQVRPYRVTCTRSFLLGMSHQSNIHTHSILIHNIIDTIHLHLYNNCCVFIALHWESCESIAKCKPSLVSTVVKSNIVWTHYFSERCTSHIATCLC